MPDPILISVKLDDREIVSGSQRIARSLSNALDAGVNSARVLGERIGKALSAGIEAGIGRPGRDERERAHARRIEAIHTQSAARLREIEAKKQAQIDTIRERSAQKEIEQQRSIQNAARSGASGFQAFMRRHASTIREAGESIQQAGFAVLSLTTLITGIGAAAVKSAIEIDQQVNVLRALTGSAEAAEKRFAQLVATAQKSPGLTTSLASTLDAQLRVLNVTEQTIDKVLPAIGRLNAVSPIAAPSKFVGNLVQLITQNFERQDLKELVGQSPFAGELIKQVFNVESPTNAKAIREAAKKLGITTVEGFFSEFSNAAANNPKLQAIGESLGTQIQKLQDRILVALRPLGLRILEIILPAVETLVPAVERLFAAFASLPSGVQTAIVAFAALAAAIAPVVILLGGLIQLTGALGNLSTIIGALTASSGAAATATAGFALAFKPLLIALAAVAVAVAVAFGAYKLYTLATADNSKELRENARAAQTQIVTAQQQIDELRKLAEKTNLTRTEQEKIRKLYDDLNPIQRERAKLYAEEAGGVDTLSGKLSGLIVLMEREQELRKEQARARAFEEGPNIVKEALQAQSTLSFVSANLDRLTTERERLAKEIALATDSQFLSKRPVEERVLVPNPNTFGIRTETRRTTQLESLQKQFEAANRQLTALESERTKLQGRVRAAAQDIQISAFGAGLDPSTFAAQFVSGDIDKFNALSSVLATAPLAAPAPTKPTRRVGGGESDSAARALRDAQLAFLRSAGENELKIITDINERGIRDLQERLDRGKISVREFFEFRQNLALDTLDHELILLNSQEAALRKSLVVAKGADRVRLETQLNDVLTQQTLKRKEILDVITETTREFVKAAPLITAFEVEQLQIVEKTRTTFNDFAEALQKARGESQKLVKERLELRRIIVDETDALKENIKQLDAQLRFGNDNFDLKAERARKEAILETRQADEEAVLSMIKNRERLADASVFHANRANAIFLDHLARQQSVTEAVAEAQIKAFEGVAGSLDRGIDRLTKKLGFFGDIINGVIKSIARNILANLFAPTFGGGGGGGAGGSGGGILGAILGRVFGPAGGGLTGDLFRMPSTFPANSLAPGGLGALINSVTSKNVSVPVSISSLPIGSIPGAHEAAHASTAGLAKTGFGALLGNLGSLFKGFGFGLPKGSAVGGLAAAAPLLGLTLGAGIGGRSTLGQIAGGIGGALVGIGSTAAPAGAGTLAPLFSNPFTAIAGGALLVGGLLLGRAAQRRSDEEASGQMLTQALQAIDQLAAGVQSGQIAGSEARSIFENQILAQFTQQIRTLKTKSVVQSRLTNQVRDLRNVFEARIPPLIAEQERKAADARRFAAVDSRLIPQFATGGISRGGLAFLHDREMVLTQTHQARIAARAGSDIFRSVGVPGVQPNARFDNGGIYAASSSQRAISGTVVIDKLFISVDAEGIAIEGMSGRNGEQIIVNHIENIKLRKGQK